MSFLFSLLLTVDLLYSTLTVLRNTGLLYHRIPIYLNLSDSFLMTWPESGVFWRETTDVFFHCHHIASQQGYTLSNVTITVDTNLDHLAEVRFVTLFHCKYIPHTPILRPLEKKSLSVSLHLRNVKLCSTSLGAKCIHKSIGMLIHRIHLFISV